MAKKEEHVLTSELPLLPIRDIVMFPSMIVPFFVGREDSLKAVSHSLEKTNRVIVLASQKEANTDNPKAEDIYPIATVCLIVKTKQMPDGRLKILTQGLH